MSMKSAKNLPVLELKHVSFASGKNLVLKDISCTVNKGDFIGLIGPNGSGKTTLIKIMLGIYKNYAGEILIGGVKLSRFNQWSKSVMFLKKQQAWILFFLQQ